MQVGNFLITNQYEEDCYQAALSDKGFDKENAKEISSLHGVDVAEVQRSINNYRRMKG